MSGRDFYGILGVARGASEDEIRRAYRKLAMKWHPDRNQSAEANARFQDISRAYEVLSTPEPRKVYNLYGEEGLQAGAAPAGGQRGAGTAENGRGGVSFDRARAEEIFRQFFGGGGGMNMGMGGGSPPPGGPRFFQARGGRPATFFTTGAGAPFDAAMNTDSDEDDIGGSPDSGFGGLGGGFGSMFGGGGRRARSRFQGHPFAAGSCPPSAQQRPSGAAAAALKPRVIQRDVPVSLEELATGFVRNLKVTKRMQDSQTGQVVETSNVLTINGKSGWKAGTKVTFENAGDELNGQPRQDLQFVICEKPHLTFVRDGDDLRTAVHIPLVDALCGASVQVPLLGGGAQSLRFDRAEPGMERILPGQGMPRKTGGRGDLRVSFNVDFPKQPLAPEQREVLANFLPRS